MPTQFEEKLDSKLVGIGWEETVYWPLFTLFTLNEQLSVRKTC